ncbi:hypothetical protein KIN20_020462 [Parelaphostrongylus tenuis]|uniref:Uncharacterized protein n=1 Tax=Parelaphostrongylus tenuis TaxID=148309 RepID=A0AAD5QTI3_PARTN|nr:hypothetical protein KIN20_020462 [Parelaphostrongylus tenuis]
MDTGGKESGRDRRSVSNMRVQCLLFTSTRSFTVSGLILPFAMVYSSETNVLTRVRGIASNKDGAQAFVRRLVMQTVFDVPELQARGALLPDAVISAILGQLTVNITCEPLLCRAVSLGLADESPPGEDMKSCIIIGNTVTGICTRPQGVARAGPCANAGVTIAPVAATHTSISGTLSTMNIVMANWSRMMWQDVMNKALRMLASGPLGPHFSASATVNGN